MADHRGGNRWQSEREHDLGTQLQRLSAQVSALQRDVQDLKRMVAALAGHSVDRSPLEPSRPPDDRAASAAERELAIESLVNLVRELRLSGASRVFTNVSEAVRRRYGDLPNERIPYERFKDFVQDAQRRGKIRLVRVGPVDHVLLADEPIQPYVESVRREYDAAKS